MPSREPRVVAAAACAAAVAGEGREAAEGAAAAAEAKAEVLIGAGEKLRQLQERPPPLLGTHVHR